MRAGRSVLCALTLLAHAATANSPHRAELSTRVVADGALLLELVPSSPYGESGFTSAIDPETGAVMWSLERYALGLEVCADSETAVLLQNVLDFETAPPATVVMQVFRSGNVVGTLELADLMPRLGEPSGWAGSRLLFAAQTLARRGFDDLCGSYTFVTADGDVYIVDTATASIAEHFVDHEALDFSEFIWAQRRR